MNLRRVLSGFLAGCVALAASGVFAADGHDGERSFRMRVMKPWPVQTKDSGGTLIFSDSPEYVKEPGILYSDVVTGSARIFYYHLNETQARGKVAVVLDNVGKKYTKVSILRSALAAPSDNYLQVGKEAETSYMSLPQKKKSFVIASGSRRILDPAMNVTCLQPGELVSGVYDIETAAPVRVTVLFYPEYADPLSFVGTAKVLPRDEEALRGTFQGMNRTIKAKRAYDPERDGVAYIPIGDNKEDAYKTGVDATDGTAALNYGNYGVLYRFEIPTEGRSSTRLMLSPLGGVYAGAVNVRHRKGVDLIQTPTDRLFSSGKSPEGIPESLNEAMILAHDFELFQLGRYAPDRKLAMEYSPPGASNLPALLILAPGGEKKKEAKKGARLILRGQER